MGKVKQTHPATILAEISTIDMLVEISKRGGHPGALAEAALLCTRKSADYNHGKGVDIHRIDRSEYFPFGALSYAQMLHTKTTRFKALVKVELSGSVPNYEGLVDTALDLINYAAFYIASEDSKFKTSDSGTVAGFGIGESNLKEGLDEEDDGRESCPVIGARCKYYCYQYDSNGEIAIEHCAHPYSGVRVEGNCTKYLCPRCKGLEKEREVL